VIQEQPFPGLELNGVPLYPLPRTALESNDKEVFVDSTAVQVIHQILQVDSRVESMAKQERLVLDSIAYFPVDFDHSQL
jgi:hypothetical protein